MEDTVDLGGRHKQIYLFDFIYVLNENWSKFIRGSVALTLILHIDSAIVDGYVGVSVYHNELCVDIQKDTTRWECTNIQVLLLMNFLFHITSFFFSV